MDSTAVVESWDKPLRGRLEPADVVSAACPTSPQLLVGPKRADVLTTGSTTDIKKAIADTRREDFRIVEYSVQDDHLHMIVEAESAAALTRGMRSFTVRVAMRINGTLRRSGRVWGDRYHRRDLLGPRETRYALVYVLANHLKHGHEATVGLLDPCSSGQWFQGWMHDRHAPPTEPAPGERPHTWLLREGWWKRGGGFIHLGERPRSR